MSDIFDGTDGPGKAVGNVPGIEGAPKTRDGGPKAPGGRKRASAGSFTQGTGGKVVLPEELIGAFEGHRDDLTRQFSPKTRYEQWLVREMALAMARLQRTENLSIADLVRCVDVA